MVAAIMIKPAIAPPRAVADHLMGGRASAVVDLEGVVGGVEPVDSDVDDPYAVEVDQPMSERPFLIVCFEECPTPLDSVKLHELLRWGEIHKTSLLKRVCQCVLGTVAEGAYVVVQHDPCDTLGVPEQLIDIIVTNDVGMILLIADKPSIDNLIFLIADEAVEGFNDGLEVKALFHRLDTTLALGGSITVVRALENEAQAFGYKANLGGLSPTKEVQSNLSHPVVMAHVFHSLSPSFG